MRILVVLVLLAGAVHPQQARFAQRQPERERTLLLGAAGTVLPERGALGPFADLDGDGDVDFLHERKLYRNDGFGVFRPARELDLALERRLGFFHANGDGVLDLLSREHLYLGDGTGRFVDASAKLPPGFVADAAVLADLDGDGDVDVLSVEHYVTPGPAEVRLSLNDGSGVFADASSSLPPTPSRPRSAACGDVDGDTDLDLVLASDGVNEVWLNDGLGGFALAAGALPAIFDHSNALALVDVDGDTDLDLVVGNDAHGGGPGDRLLLNDGSGVFAEGLLPFTATLRKTEALLVLDREDDGDPDLVFLDSSQLDVLPFSLPFDATDRLLVNDGSGGFSASADLPALRGQSRAGFAGDVDGDGDADLVLEDAQYPNRIYLNDGQGVFAATREASHPLADSNAMEARVAAIGDVNGDALADLFTAQEILIGGPPGVFTPLGAPLPDLPYCNDPPTHLPWPFAFDVSLGDIDGDGDLDAYIAGGGLGECAPVQDNVLWINDGAGGFADETPARLPTGWLETDGNPVQVELLELDGDGDLDAACVRQHDWDASGESSCYANDGNGVFTRRGSMGGASSSGALGDLDGDGDADYLEGSDEFRNSVYLNDGTAQFVHSPSALPAHPSPLEAGAVVLGDIDRDGDLDAYVSNHPGPFQPSFVYVNAGNGAFADEPARLPVSLTGNTSGIDLAFADLDLDGDQDLLAPQALYRNDGRGFFASAPEHTRPFAFGASMAVGDLDLDGDPDVLGADLVATTVGVAFARHLEALGPARIGKAQALVVHGPTSTPYTLLESLGTIRAPLGAMGWLLVDPSRIVLVSGGRLDGSGQARFQRLIPSDVALLGRTTYWQAFVGRRAHSTNVVVTRITAL